MNQVALQTGSVAGTPTAVEMPTFFADGHWRQLLEGLPAAIYTTDAEGRITFYNQAAVTLAGREPVLGSDQWCVTWRLYRPDGVALPHDECPMAITLKENRPVRGVEAVAERPDGTRVPFLPFPTPIRDSSGKLIGAVNMLVDISERKEAETQQYKLLHELNHRVKNNMQMLQSLLSAAQREARTVEAREALADASRRVGAMAAAQHVMYDENALAFEAEVFLAALTRNASQVFGRQADIGTHAAPGLLSNDTAMPLTLILNELLTNSVKHGRAGRGHVNVTVGLDSEGEDWVLTVQDDGPGYELQDTFSRSSGLGLVKTLARQLGGNFTVSTIGGTQGARCTVRFPAR